MPSHYTQGKEAMHAKCCPAVSAMNPMYTSPGYPQGMDAMQGKLLRTRALWLVAVCGQDLPQELWQEAYAAAVGHMASSDLVVALMAVTAVLEQSHQVMEELQNTQQEHAMMQRTPYEEGAALPPGGSCTHKDMEVYRARPGRQQGHAMMQRTPSEEVAALPPGQVCTGVLLYIGTSGMWQKQTPRRSQAPYEEGAILLPGVLHCLAADPKHIGQQEPAMLQQTPYEEGATLPPGETFSWAQRRAQTPR